MKDYTPKQGLGISSPPFMWYFPEIGFSQIECVNNHGHLLAVWSVLFCVLQATPIFKSHDKTYQTILKSNLRNIREWTSKGNRESYASWGCLAVVIMLLPHLHLNKRVRNAMCQAWIWTTTKNLIDLLGIKKVMGIILACSGAGFSSQFFPVQAHKSCMKRKGRRPE